MKYSVSIDVPSIDEGLRFYGEAFGFVETARPVDGYAVLKCGDAEIGLPGNPQDRNQLKGPTTCVDMIVTGPRSMLTSM